MIKVRVYLKRSYLFCWLMCISAVLSAQSINQQSWFEYLLNNPFGKAFNLEHGFTYSTLFNKPRWHALDYSASLEYSISPYVDVMTQMIVSYTHQNESYNTIELRPIIGTRFRFTPNNRLLTGLLLRVEDRNIKNLESGDWESVLRPRIRAELIYPINKASYSTDKLWYSTADAEVLFATSDVQERFANRFRFRVGVGYRLSYNWRFEFMYMLQQSRDELNNGFESSDNIFRFRIKQYLHKHQDNKPMGVGN